MQVESAGVPIAISRSEPLERAIGPWALAANAVNLAVGAGVFALPGTVAGILGPSAILAYVICGLTISSYSCAVRSWAARSRVQGE